MRGIRLKEEISQVKALLEAAGIELVLEGEHSFSKIPLFVENILSMCLKEAVTNVVKHSQATTCHISINQAYNEIIITVSDNGVGVQTNELNDKGNGLLGMKERLEFVNGNLTIKSDQGLSVMIQVPNVIKQDE